MENFLAETKMNFLQEGNETNVCNSQLPISSNDSRNEFLNLQAEKRQKIEPSLYSINKVKQEYDESIKFTNIPIPYSHPNLSIHTTPISFLKPLSNTLEEKSDKEAFQKTAVYPGLHEPSFINEPLSKLPSFDLTHDLTPPKISLTSESTSEPSIRSNNEKDAVQPPKTLSPLDATPEFDDDNTPSLQLEKGNTILGPLTESFASRQFWHAGDYKVKDKDSRIQKGGMDHVRVHPKFLHSNATSHKWALGAIAELLDNAIDEVCHGATYVDLDMILSPSDNQPMLLIQDDGGGMNPERMRSCISLGYSEKSKKANTIGQYGNGFKTSTMRLGADVIVFSKSPGYGGNNATQSIGLLSFTFLRDTGKEDIIVPMIDYEVMDGKVDKLIRSNEDDFEDNLKTIVKWSPFFSEYELLQQFDDIEEHGTKIIVYNLWLTDEGELELDFDTDTEDIQVRGARDPVKLKMAQKYPNSHHYLTYAHSLRSYTSILYLRRPHNFRIYLRGKEVMHHNLVDDLMHIEEVVYRPKGEERETGMMAVVTIGFVKDAKEHIDVQGFNVYHKNRLIKPFWKIWNASSSQGRGVIGVLEANFVEPAHDKQGFERTQVLQRLEHRLLQMQKSYWNQKSYLVGYISAKQNKILNLANNLNTNNKININNAANINLNDFNNNMNMPSVNNIYPSPSPSPSALDKKTNGNYVNENNYEKTETSHKIWDERGKPKSSVYENQKMKGSCLLPIHSIKEKIHDPYHQLIPYENGNSNVSNQIIINASSSSSSHDPLLTIHLQEENQYLRLRCENLEKCESENKKLQNQVVLLKQQVSDMKHEREREHAMHRASSSSENLLKTQLKAALRRVRNLEVELRSKDVIDLS